MTKTLPSKTDRIDRHEGVDAYGLHVEYVRYHKDGANAGRLHSQVQIFLAENNVYLYQRSAGSKKARWTTLKYDTHQTAREQVRSLLAKSESTIIGVEPRGVPTLVQLTETDIEAMRAGEKPSARYDGGTRNNRLFGKIDDEIWSPGL